MAKRATELARGLRRRQKEAEVRLWSRVRDRRLGNLKFRRQVPREPFVVDFLCDEAMLIVELDGSQHDEQLSKEARRTAYLESLGCVVLRVRNYDLLQNADRVLDHIWAVAVERTKAPSSGPSGHLLPKGRRAAVARVEKSR
jgi:very-short-patch-repair endonuclease